MDDLDALKHEYLTPTPDREVDRVFVEHVANYVIGKLSGPRVLEMGAGDRLWTPRLVRAFPDVTTLDGSQSLLETLGEELELGEGKRWTPVCSMFEDYTPDAPFDTVVSTYVLEHVHDPAAVVARMRSWVAPGGELAVVVPSALSLHRRLAVTMGLQPTPGDLGETDGRMGHHHCFTPDAMRQLLTDAGFTVTESRGMITKALPNAQLVGCSPEQLKGLFELGLELPLEYAAAMLFLARA